MQRNSSKQTLIEYFSVLLVATILLVPIFHVEIYLSGPNDSDYFQHTNWAQELLQAPQNVPSYVVAHSAWQWAVIITHEIVMHSWRAGAFIVTLGSALFTVGILFWLLRKKLMPLLAGALAIGLTVAAPLAFLYPLDHELYFGYIGIDTYHNPTILLLKPFAILQLFYSAEALQGKVADWKSIFVTVLVSAVAAFAKPNYLICLLPALGILALISIWKKHPIDWKRLLIGIVLPSMAILAWQFFLTYGSDGGSSIILAPFGVMQGYSSYLPEKFILSIVFPTIVTAIYWKEAIKDTRMQLGWIGFGLGVIFTYFFAESGVRFHDGNFTWSGEIALFILFVCCILFLSERELHLKSRVSRWLILSSGFLHVIFGYGYYLAILFTLNFH